MIVGKISKKGQVVIPKEIRDKLNIMPGDILIFKMEGDRIIIERLREKLKEVLKAGKPVGHSVEFQKKLREEWE